MKLAMKNQERIRAFIGVAAAPDFTDEVMLGLAPQQYAELESNGVTYFPTTPPAPPLPITKKFIEESRQHFLLYSAVPIRCPVRLLQGMQDPDIPWQHMMLITRAITHGDVRITLVKDGGHRLSRAEDMDLLWAMIGEFLC
jgi:pimeloyl-ACP methyl ester carboxylesterase